MLNLLPSNQILVLNQFLQMFQKEKIHHALIISGKKGIGKFDVALLLTKIILSCDISNLKNIANLDNLSIDNKVSHLVSNNYHPNFLLITPEFDEQKKKFKDIIGVENIKKINEFLHKSFEEDKYKVIIINSLDHLNINSNNALLKSLEEPSKNTIFLLICDNYSLLLDTIKSRCLNFKMKSLADNDIKTIMSNLDLDNSYQDDVIKIVNGSRSKLLWFQEEFNINVFKTLYKIIHQEIMEHQVIDFINTLKFKADLDTDFILEIIKFYINKKLNSHNFSYFIDLFEYINDTKMKINPLHLDKYSIILNILFKMKKYEKLLSK